MMSTMRIAVQVDDEILEQLKAQARKEKASLTRVLNRALRNGLKVSGARGRKQPIHRMQVHDMGAPLLPLEKALALAAALEDEEIVRNLTLRK